MDLKEIYLELALFSKIYFVVMALFVLGYLLRSAWHHRCIIRLRSLSVSDAQPRLTRIEAHITGLRQAQSIALGLGRALLAAQLSGLLLEFSPILRGADVEPWFGVQTFVILSQICFLPVLILLVLDWLLTAHLRHATLPR